MDMVSYLLSLGADKSIMGKSNRNYARAIFRARQHGHHALAQMLHDWKAEKDEEYSGECDSIEVILRTVTPEILVFTEDCEPVWEEMHYRGICTICVPWSRIQSVIQGLKSGTHLEQSLLKQVNNPMDVDVLSFDSQ